MLLSITTAFSQNATKTSKDSLVYTPKYLMQFMLEDLEECDQVRSHIIEMQADIKHQQNSLDEKDRIIANIRAENIRLQNYNDSLSIENTTLQVTGTKQYSSLRKSRNWWVATAIAGVLSAVAVHIHWKYGEGAENR